MSNIFPKKPKQAQSFKGKIWMDFIMKQMSTSNQTCTASQFSSPRKVIGTNTVPIFILLHRPKREKYNLTTSKIGSRTTSKFALFRKQKVNSERLHVQERSKREHLQFYKPATHLNGPSAWVCFGLSLWLRSGSNLQRETRPRSYRLRRF